MTNEEPQEHGSPFPPSWQKTGYDPTTIDLKGKAYLNVEGRRAWLDEKAALRLFSKITVDPSGCWRWIGA